MLSEDKGRSNISARMLVIKVADDAASQYLSFMNVIFAGIVNLLSKLFQSNAYYEF